jgi:hypothetical protein
MNNLKFIIDGQKAILKYDGEFDNAKLVGFTPQKWDNEKYIDRTIKYTIDGVKKTKKVSII